jgi:hypothetical protein
MKMAVRRPVFGRLLISQVVGILLEHAIVVTTILSLLLHAYALCIQNVLGESVIRVDRRGG